MQIAHRRNSQPRNGLLVQQRTPTRLQLLDGELARELGATVHHAQVVGLLDADDEREIVDRLPSSEILGGHLIAGDARFLGLFGGWSHGRQ